MIYVITCGKYEENHNSLVTDDYNKALVHILERYNYRGISILEQCIKKKVSGNKLKIKKGFK